MIIFFIKFIVVCKYSPCNLPHRSICHSSFLTLHCYLIVLIAQCYVQLTNLNEKIEFEVIQNTDVLIFAQFNNIFTSYELKLTLVPSCDSDSLSNALVLYLSIGTGCLIAGFIAFTLINKRYENKLLNK